MSVLTTVDLGRFSVSAMEVTRAPDRALPWMRARSAGVSSWFGLWWRVEEEEGEVVEGGEDDDGAFVAMLMVGLVGVVLVVMRPKIQIDLHIECLDDDDVV